MEESLISWFVLFFGSIAGGLAFVRTALNELESRKNEPN